MTTIIDMLIVLVVLTLQGVIFTGILLASIICITGFVYVIYPESREDIQNALKPIKKHLCKFVSTMLKKLYTKIWKEEP